jgi:hypothetical protein
MAADVVEKVHERAGERLVGVYAGSSVRGC